MAYGDNSPRLMDHLDDFVESEPGLHSPFLDFIALQCERKLPPGFAIGAILTARELGGADPGVVADLQIATAQTILWYESGHDY